MGTLSGAIPLPRLEPAFGKKVIARTRVDYENTPEGALVRRAQSGDESAFGEIVARYQSKVFSIIHGIVRQRNDVEDIAQQVFAKVYFSIRNFDFRSSLITWIYKITVNECFDYLRKKKVRKLVYERHERRRSKAGGKQRTGPRQRSAGRLVPGAAGLRGQAHGPGIG